MTYLRTTISQQNDTLDAISYRFFGNQSNDYLPQLVTLNPNLAPAAVIAIGSTVILPFDTPSTTQSTLKLWD